MPIYLCISSDIRLPSQKSLFQLQAERIHRLRYLASKHANKPLSSISLPWYIMTSIITHQPTLSYFKQHNYFSLSSSDIFFFQQRELPALSNDGRILLDSPYKIALSPNGNGGIFDALQYSGALADMIGRGIQHTQIYGVDNALIRIADPTFIGFSLLQHADVVNKVVLKTDPTEKVGVMCMRPAVSSVSRDHYLPYVIEYSELPLALSTARDPHTNTLLYNAGNIAQHYFSTAFLHSISSTSLQYHMARKAIPYIDIDSGQLIKPTQPNGIKLELFIFDIFESVPNILAFAVERESEFAAVKNAERTDTSKPIVADSAETARLSVCSLHRSWVSAAGGIAKGDGLIEVSPFISYGGEELTERVAGQVFETPCEIK